MNNFHTAIDDPKVINIHNPNYPIAFIGDIHGCYQELKELLEKLYDKWPNIQIVSLGDVVDRGPYSEMCLELLLKDSAFWAPHSERFISYSKPPIVIIGNHDRKIIRKFLGNEVIENKDQLWYQKLTKEQRNEILDLYKDCPTAVKVWYKDGAKIVAAHGGVPSILKESDIDVDKLKKKDASVCWYGNTTGKKDENGYPERLHVPAGSKDLLCIYGHIVYDPREFNYMINDNPGISVYIDHGSVFGGWLSAFVAIPINEKTTITEVVSVRCKEYMKSDQWDFSGA